MNHRTCRGPVTTQVSNMSQPASTSPLPLELANHPGFARVFQPGHLTFGFIAPLESYPDSPGPTLANHLEMARKADEGGFSAIWLRDVPFYDPNFGDVGQVLDPMVYAGFLAAVTHNIAIGTAGIVLPLRDPLIVAKQAASVDQLLAGRFILGLASGDRPVEYPAFGMDFNNRADRFRDALGVIRAATEQHWPRHQSRHYGQLTGNLDLMPSPVGARLPTLTIGMAGQTMEWAAEHTDGILWYLTDPARLPAVLDQWQTASHGKPFKPYGYGTFFDLDRDPDCPLQVGRVMRAGRKALIDLWRRQQDQGVNHIALNFKPQQRPAAEVIDEMGEYILPHFPSRPLLAR
jgi:luciferase-type oxidoreductase